MTPTLSPRQLNRATLARQMLLARESTSPLQAIERLAGMQAQLPRPPFIGLWSRLRDFRRESLTELLDRREVVRATMMRCTLHLLSARDYLRLRPTVQPVLTRAMGSILGERTSGFDVADVVRAARAWFTARPGTFQGLRSHLMELYPQGDERAMGYAVRTHLPLVQVPAATPWGYPGTADFTPADAWLDTAVEVEAAPPHPLVLSYLAAFGPAAVTDVQTWSGLTALREVLDELRPQLLTFRDERGRELFDLPGAPRPPADTPAPVRFLPDFDNLLLAHDDRTRVVADAYRSRLTTANLRVLPTFLVDGQVAGTWEIEKARSTATLLLTPFEPLPAAAQSDLEEEGMALTRFVESGAKVVQVEWK